LNWKACTLSPAECRTDERWRALWEESPQRSLFSSLPYAEAVRDVLGLPFRVLAAEGAYGFAAAVPVFERGARPFRRMVIPPLCPFVPPLLVEAPSEADVHGRASALDFLLGVLERTYAYAQLHLDDSLRDVRPFRWRGWDVAPLYTYVTPLGTGEPVDARWSAGPRETFRRHRDRCVITEGVETAETVAGLCAASYGRHGRKPPAPPDRMAALARALHEQGLARLFACTPSGEDDPAAGLVVLRDGTMAYYWMAGSRPGPAMTVLIGRVLESLSADGTTEFDFMGANTPRIAEFKRRFGPTLTTYHRCEKLVSPLLRPVKRWL
jgi:hypothetical protein